MVFSVSYTSIVFGARSNICMKSVLYTVSIISMFSIIAFNTSHCIIGPHYRYNVEHAVGSGKSGRVTAGVFGCINTSGVGEITDVGPHRFTGQMYAEISEKVLLLSVRAVLYPQPQPFTILLDNSPIHTCRVVRSWVAEHSEIIVLPHPPKSPNLNPVKHM